MEQTVIHLYGTYTLAHLNRPDTLLHPNVHRYYGKRHFKEAHINRTDTLVHANAIDTLINLSGMDIFDPSLWNALPLNIKNISLTA